MGARRKSGHWPCQPHYLVERLVAVGDVLPKRQEALAPSPSQGVLDRLGLDGKDDKGWAPPRPGQERPGRPGQRIDQLACFSILARRARK